MEDVVRCLERNSQARAHQEPVNEPAGEAKQAIDEEKGGGERLRRSRSAEDPTRAYGNHRGRHVKHCVGPVTREFTMGDLCDQRIDDNLREGRGGGTTKTPIQATPLAPVSGP